MTSPYQKWLQSLSEDDWATFQAHPVDAWSDEELERYIVDCGDAWCREDLHYVPRSMLVSMVRLLMGGDVPFH